MACEYNIQYNAETIIKLLNHPDINIDVENNKKQTALDVAQECNNGSYKIIKDYVDHDRLTKSFESEQKGQNKKPEKIL